ncbi:MAG TPA: MFS transporter [Thermoleophilaceae bacterium]
MARRRDRRSLIPLVLATLAAQASIMVLAPIMVEIGRNLDASVSAVGQARTVMAAVAAAASLRVGPLVDRIGVRPVLTWGAVFAATGHVVTSMAGGLAVFYAGHVFIGLGVACLLSAGFAGAGAWFDEEDAPWALGYVVASQSIAWIVGNPIIGILTDAVSWRLAYAVPGAAALAALAAGLLARAGRREKRSEPTRSGMTDIARDPSARRWTVAEFVAYSAWTAELTYIGAFYVQTYDVRESLVGFLLAIGSVAFLISTLGTDRLVRRLGGRRRRMVIGSALGMGSLVLVIMNVTPAVAFTVSLFFLMALCAGVRSTGSSALALGLMPSQPGAMMAARTTSAQLGYTLGAMIGGLVIAVAGFGALGVFLFVGMAFSAVLIARVGEPQDAVAR